MRALNLENDSCLNAIEKTVQKYFSKHPASHTKSRKRRISSANGRSVTDINELALVAIKKKKTSQVKTSKGKASKKITNTWNNDDSHTTNIPNINEAVATSLPNISATPVSTINPSLPPISNMLATNISPTLLTCQPESRTFTTLQTLWPMTTIQCQSWFVSIQPLEVTRNWIQCARILCWQCSSKMDTTHQLCESCRRHYQGLQHTKL